jgi:hypothetical protein
MHCWKISKIVGIVNFITVEFLVKAAEAIYRKPIEIMFSMSNQFS